MRRISTRLNLGQRAASALAAGTFFLFAAYLFEGFSRAAPVYAEALNRDGAQAWFSQTSLAIAAMLAAMTLGKFAAGYASTQLAVRAWTGWPRPASER